jgi:hypothetical protein
MEVRVVSVADVGIWGEELNKTRNAIIQVFVGIC